MGKVNRESIVSIVVLVIISLVHVPVVVPQEEPVQILFMHHSTGAGLIEQGGVRAAFTALGYEFWDHDYNDIGVADPSGNILGVNWNVPDDNTDPDGWYTIFNQPVTDPPTNTLSHMLQADVIIFKSCFPTSNIGDETQLQEYQRYYLSIRDVMDRYPDKLFIPFTPPPLVPNETTAENAARAKSWASYLASEDYGAGHPNVKVFDFFEHLADENGYLQSDYRGDEWDSHPNARANSTVGPVFVAFVDQALREFTPGPTSSAPVGSMMSDVPFDTAESVAPVETEDTGDETNTSVQNQHLITDFEEAAMLDMWWNYTGTGVHSFTCELDQQAHTGEWALKLSFHVDPQGSAGCGGELEIDSDWAAADGIRFYWRADQPELLLRVAFLVEDPEIWDPEGNNRTPFEIEMNTISDEWSLVTIAWDDLIKPEWVGDTGPKTFDPAYVAEIAFDVGHWEVMQLGTIWIDDFELNVSE